MVVPKVKKVPLGVRVVDDGEFFTKVKPIKETKTLQKSKKKK